MINHTAAFLLSSGFVLGGMAIHALQRYATALTPPLAAVTLGLTVLVGLISLAESADDRRGDEQAGVRPFPQAVQQEVRR